MKAEKHLKVWSIITMVLSILLIISLFTTLFKAIAVGAFLVEFYEDFTNEVGTSSETLFSIFFKIAFGGLCFILVVNQVLMWVRQSILKKNYTNLKCRKEAIHHEKRKNRQREERKEESFRKKNC